MRGARLKSESRSARRLFPGQILRIQRYGIVRNVPSIRYETTLPKWIQCLSICLQELEARLFGTAEPSSEADMSVQRYMSSCSNTQATFSRDNVLIVGPVDLDCE